MQGVSHGGALERWGVMRREEGFCDRLREAMFGDLMGGFKIFLRLLGEAGLP